MKVVGRTAKMRRGFLSLDAVTLLAGSSSIAAAAFVAAAGLLGASAVQAQVVKAPKYQSQIEAPAPQLTLPPLPRAITPNGQVVENVVVRVNDQIISRSDVERAEQQLEQDARQNNAQSGDLAGAEKNLLRDMIDQQLLLSRAKELGLNADADVIRQLDDIRKKNNMNSMEELEAAIKSQGLNIDDFKAQIKNQILTQQVVRDEVGRRLQLTQSEEDKYYQEHKAEFQQPEQVDLSEILVPLGENATPAEIVQAEKKASGLKTQIMQGENFAAVAKKDSGGPTAAQGGELGLFKRGQLAKVLEDQTFGLKVGETTQPVRTRQGFVILKVNKHDMAGPAPITSVEPQIQEAIYMQQMQPALRAYLTKLRDEAYIDIQPGFVDSGASPGETKPVFTTYTAPPAKKKVEKKVVRFDRNGRATYVPASQVKAPVVASPDTTGSRTLTGAEAAPLIDPKTGLAQIPGVTGTTAVASNKKQKRIKREKIRFGQAPRESLASNQTGEAPASVQPGNPGPGTALILPGGTVANGEAQQAAAEQAVATAPAPPPVGKTRFAAKSAEVKENKAVAVSAKAKEKASATPTPATAEETAAAKVQAAPLGLAGDTTKKPRKPKRVKGAPKERLEDKPAAAKPVAAPVDPTANPSLAPTSATPATVKTPPNAASPVNSSQPQPATPGGTTLPPVTAPPPGSPTQGQPVPGTQPPQ